MSFGFNLARIRRSRGWSQEELSGRAGLSQRHLSFLETGRARPGDQSLAKLSKALALRGWEHRALFASLAPLAELSMSREHEKPFIDEMVERVSHWPAYAFRPDGTLLAANGALGRLLAEVAPRQDLWNMTAPSTGPNIYDLLFHPAGLVRWLTNPRETLSETLRRVRIEAAQDRALLPVLSRLEGYPSAELCGAFHDLPPPVLIERYRIANKDLAIISVLTHFASPGDLELDSLRIESFVPADDASEALVAHICG
ncbi:helix-turn-helix domain-containing protein [Erythrobacter rubeus]|uniref:Helix-turn-helix domain-containing protein n=1 Tax=Erythrobacter rubeus TaxID=2760803 RepID=A0ABR8KP37_9SPHN|nr:helix-turn-helix domain-containing protein [Erythrobacter rubeus]MBD2842395.1 helix-turn-helix domain-containing protein [Erythrobacter rubeus]